MIRGESNFDDNYVEKVFNKCSTNVQLVRVSSFRNDLLQNPYLSESEVGDRNLISIVPVSGIIGPEVFDRTKRI